MEKDKKEVKNKKEKIVKSICPFCGCGCRLGFVVKNNKIVRIIGDSSDYMSEGKPCIKGLSVHECYNKARYKVPLLRKNGKLKRINWKKALEVFCNAIKDLDAQEVIFIGSGKTTNENNYVLEKFARIFGYSVDNCCSRLCHQATVNAMLEHFGNSNLTTLSELDTIDTLLIIGSNPASNYPVFFNKILERKSKIKLIGISSIESETLKACHQKFLINPGTDYVLLNGIIAELLRRQAYNKDVEAIENFSSFKKSALEFNKELVCEICGIDNASFEQLIYTITSAKVLGISHGMGFTQHVYGHENLHSLINLAILKQAKLFNLRGEVNVQGAGDMACCPERLPTDGLVSLPILEKEWKVKLETRLGKNLIEAIFEDPVKVIVMVEFNPSQSLPNLNYVHKIFKKTFLICLQSHKSLTAEKFASLILPIPMLFEEEGTIANGERKVRKVEQVVSSKLLSPWQIFCKLAKMLGKGEYFNYKSTREIFAEITRVIPDYKGLEKVWEGEDSYASKQRKWFKFVPVQFKGIESITSKKYPLMLVTYRSKWHFLTDELTRLSKTLQKLSDENAFFINPKQAKKLKLNDGDRIVVRSEIGVIEGNLKLSESIPEKIVATTFHSDKLLINKIIPARFDPSTFTPNFKSIAVSVKKAKNEKRKRR
ncbi:MAG: molybdopterin-dependent oxidoreductase [Candidatus Pacearchaeota archaeon]